MTTSTDTTPASSWSLSKFWMIISCCITTFGFGWGALMAFADIAHSDAIDWILTFTGASPQIIFFATIAALLLLICNAMLSAARKTWCWVCVFSFLAFVWGMIYMLKERNDRSAAYISTFESAPRSISLGMGPGPVQMGDYRLSLTTTNLDLGYTTTRGHVIQIGSGESIRHSIVLRLDWPAHSISAAEAEGTFFISISRVGLLVIPPGASTIINLNDKFIQNDAASFDFFAEGEGYIRTYQVCGNLISESDIGGGRIAIQHFNPLGDNPKLTEVQRDPNATGLAKWRLVVLDGWITLIQHNGIRPQHTQLLACK